MKRIYEADITKGIGIILVVLGHSFLLPAPTELSNHYLSILRSIIYSFHMPLFFCIAGYFMKLDITFKKLLMNRGIRLLIPYFFIGIVFAPIKSLLSKYAAQPYHVNKIIELFWGRNTLDELWFLYFLFLITVLYYILRQKLSSLSVLGITFFAYFIMAAFSIHHVFFVRLLYFIPYFALGVVIKEYKLLSKINFNNRILIIIISMFVLFNYWLYPFYLDYRYKTVYYIIVMCTSLIGIVMIYEIALFISKSKKFEILSSILAQLGIYSMQIYILSDFITFGSRIVLWKYFHAYHVAWLFGFIFGVFGSYWLSKHIFEKNKFLNRVFFGVNSQSKFYLAKK